MLYQRASECLCQGLVGASAGARPGAASLSKSLCPVATAEMGGPCPPWPLGPGPALRTSPRSSLEPNQSRKQHSGFQVNAQTPLKEKYHACVSQNFGKAKMQKGRPGCLFLRGHPFGLALQSETERRLAILVVFRQKRMERSTKPGSPGDLS